MIGRGSVGSLQVVPLGFAEVFIHQNRIFSTRYLKVNIFGIAIPTEGD